MSDRELLEVAAKAAGYEIDGYSTRCFDPAGQDDIGGGCGQLWFVQDWMRNNPELARPSVGRTIPIVHAPSSR